MLGGITVNELIDALRADSPGGPTPPPIERTGAANGAHHSTLAMLERLDSSVTDTTGAGTRLDEERLELLRRKLAERGLARPTGAASVATYDEPRMSAGQHRMWFVQSVDPDSALLNICVSYRLLGAVDAARLHRAVDAVAARHPVLHTTYDTDGDGDPRPVVRDDLHPEWSEHDLSGLADQARRLRLDVLAQRDFRRPFDLSKDSPCASPWRTWAPTS